MALSSVLSTLLMLACAKATIAQMLTVYHSANADCQSADKNFVATFQPVPTDFTACNPATEGTYGAAIVVQFVSTVTEVKFSYWTGAACNGTADGTTTFTPGEATTKLYGGDCAPGVTNMVKNEQMMMTGVPASAWDTSKAAGPSTTQGVATTTITQGATSTATATMTTTATQGATSTKGATASTAGATAPAVVASGAAQTSLAFLLIWAFAAVL